MPDHLDPSDPRSGDEFNAAELRPDIETALAGLTPEFRAAVVLVDLDGMSLEGAADTLEIPVGTVKSRVFRARRQLAKDLGNFAPGSEHPSDDHERT
jgi:RNA polymerase sigma-70 factor (ECF subfamily)